MQNQVLFRAACLLALPLIGSLAALAQSAQLVGKVSDPTGAVVPGVEVKITNTDTGVGRAAATNEQGYYRVPLLPPGNYRLSLTKEGFKPVRNDGIVLETDIVRTVDVTLEVGTQTEVVEVTTAAPLLESEESTVGQLIERTTVANMPVESRRSSSLVRLLGGVAFRDEFDGESIPNMSMAGGRGNNQMWNLDGAVAQNTALGTAFLVLNPPAESLQEFKVELNNYSAEYGRAGGGLVQMTTRSGTNQWHGAAYHFLRNDALDARSFFARTKAPLRYNVFGTSLGGPIIKNKTFFFFNYEGARRREGLTISDPDVPHPQEVLGDFSARRDLTVRDPTTGNAFPGNVIPASRLDPMGKAFAAFWPAPNVPGNDVTRAPRDNYLVNVSNRLDQNFWTGRVDHALGDKDRIYGRFSYMKVSSNNSPVYPNAFADFRQLTRPFDHPNFVGSWTRIFNPNLVTELRYNYGYRPTGNVTAGASSGINGKLGLGGVDPEGFPQILTTGLSNLGASLQFRDQRSLTQQAIGHVTWSKGNHQVKTGFEFRYSSNADIFNVSPGGSFTFNDRATGSGLASMLLGWTSSAALVTTDLITSRTDFYGLYIQDDWKLSSKLTLSFGLRWDLDTPRHETANRQSGFDGKAINPVAGVPGAMTFAGLDGRSQYAHNFDTNNFGPRFGLAYRLNAGLVVRAGYGIYYNGAYVNVVRNLVTGFGNNASFPSTDGGLTPAFLFRNGIPTFQREALGPGFGAVALGRAPRTSVDFLQQNHQNGYNQQFNLTVQKTLGRSMVMELAYLGNLGRKLPGPNVSRNMIPLVNGRGPDRQNQALRPYPQYSDVLQASPDWGNSSYHAFNAKLEKRYSNGLNFTTNFTWSKFLDDIETGEFLGGAQGNGYQHTELRALDKSYSGNDVRLRFVGSTVYELPFGRGRRFEITNPIANAIAGGWGVGVITELRTGSPYGALEQTDTSNTFGHGQRPNLLRSPEITADRSRQDKLNQWFDTAAFAMPTVGTFGNSARNVGFGPGFIGLDVSVHKYWQLTERFRLQFRTDIYNLPNHANFANPELRRGNPAFGRISSVLPGTNGRLLQYSLRLEF
jgi:hypothetical protein